MPRVKLHKSAASTTISVQRPSGQRRDSKQISKTAPAAPAHDLKELGSPSAARSRDLSALIQQPSPMMLERPSSSAASRSPRRAPTLNEQGFLTADQRNASNGQLEALAPTAAQKSLPTSRAHSAESSATISVWAKRPLLCGYTPEREQWAISELAKRGEGKDSLEELHRHMDLLVANRNLSANLEIFELLVSWPRVQRAELVSALSKLVGAPALNCGKQRAKFVQHLVYGPSNNFAPALELMRIFEGVRNNAQYLRLFDVLRLASPSTALTIIDRIYPYIQVTSYTNGEHIITLLKHCMTLDPDEALAFCHFLSDCSRTARNAVQTTSSALVKAASQVQRVDRGSFAQQIGRLSGSNYTQSTGRHSFLSRTLAYVTALVTIHPSLRTCAVASVCKIFHTNAPGVVFALRHESLSVFGKASVADFLADMQAMQIMLPDNASRIAAFCDVFACIPAALCESAIHATRRLTEGGCVDTKLRESLRALIGIHQFIKATPTRADAQIVHSASWTISTMHSCVQLGNQIDLFLMLLAKPEVERVGIIWLIDKLVIRQAPARYRIKIIKQVMGQPAALLARIASLMAPYAFTEAHNASVSLALFFALLRTTQFNLLPDIEKTMQDWHDEDVMADVPSCAALRQYYKLNDLLVAHTKKAASRDDTTFVAAMEGRSDDPTQMLAVTNVGSADATNLTNGFLAEPVIVLSQGLDKLT